MAMDIQIGTIIMAIYYKVILAGIIIMAIMVGTMVSSGNDKNYIYWNGNHYYRMSDGLTGSTAMVSGSL